MMATKPSTQKKCKPSVHEGLSALCRGYGDPRGVIVVETPIRRNGNHSSIIENVDCNAWEPLIDGVPLTIRYHDIDGFDQRSFYSDFINSNWLEMDLPKTYLTRRGEMMLFVHRSFRDNYEDKDNRIEIGKQSMTVKELKRQLTSSLPNIPQYTKTKRQPSREDYVDFRPGYSPARYLASWSRLWASSEKDPIQCNDNLIKKHIEHYKILPEIERSKNEDPLKHILKPKPHPFSPILLPKIEHKVETGKILSNNVQLQNVHTPSITNSAKSVLTYPGKHEMDTKSAFEKTKQNQNWSVKSQASSHTPQHQTHKRIGDFKKIPSDSSKRVIGTSKGRDIVTVSDSMSERDEFQSYLDKNIDAVGKSTTKSVMQDVVDEFICKETVNNETESMKSNKLSGKISLKSIESPKFSVSTQQLDPFNQLPPINSDYSTSISTTNISVKFPYLQKRLTGQPTVSETMSSKGVPSVTEDDLHVKGLAMDQSDTIQEMLSQSEDAQSVTGFLTIDERISVSSESSDEWEEAARVAVTLSKSKERTMYNLDINKPIDLATTPLFDNINFEDTEKAQPQQEESLEETKQGELDIKVPFEEVISISENTQTLNHRFNSATENNSTTALVQDEKEEKEPVPSIEDCSVAVQQCDRVELGTSSVSMVAEDSSEVKEDEQEVSADALSNGDEMLTNNQSSKPPFEAKSDDVVCATQTSKNTHHKTEVSADPTASDDEEIRAITHVNITKRSAKEITEVHPSSPVDKNISKNDRHEEVYNKMRDIEKKIQNLQDIQKGVNPLEQSFAESEENEVNTPKRKRTKSKRLSGKTISQTSLKNSTPPFHTGLVPDEKGPTSLDSKVSKQSLNLKKNKVTKKTKKVKDIAVLTKDSNKAMTNDSNKHESVASNHQYEVSLLNDGPESSLHDQCIPDEKVAMHNTSVESIGDGSISEFSVGDLIPSDEQYRKKKAFLIDKQTTETTISISSEDEDLNLKFSHIADARARKRAIAAEKRRQDVERRRLEKELERKLEQEKADREEQLRLEAENDKKRWMEERRRRKEEEEKEMRLRAEEEENRLMQIERKKEAERKAKEERRMKLLAIAAERKLEEELRREKEEMEERIEKEMREREQQLLLQLEEKERREYEKQLKEESELRRLLEEQLRKEEEIRKEELEKEHERLMKELHNLQKQIIERNKQIKKIKSHNMCLGIEHKLSRAFTYSYFDKEPSLINQYKGIKEFLIQNDHHKLDSIKEDNES